MMAKMVPYGTISVGIRGSTRDTSAAFRGLPRDENARGNHAEIAAAALTLAVFGQYLWNPCEFLGGKNMTNITKMSATTSSKEPPFETCY
jgi:hypothetical protein